MSLDQDELQHILELHPNPFVVHVNFKPLYANEAFAQFSGLESVAQVLELDSLMVLINPEEHEDSRQRYQDAIQYSQTEPRVIAHTDLNGNPVLVEIIDKKVTWQSQQALCTYISVVTDTINKERHLKQMAEQDYLTELPNRRYISRVLDKLSLSGTSNQYFEAILDIDHFKRVNDQFGHYSGDKVLQQFAQILRCFVRQEDHLARLGGEEFILLLKEHNIDNIEQRLNDLRRLVEQTSFCVNKKENQSLRCTLSIGATQIQPNEALDLSYRRVDKALYQAKQTGRNKVVLIND
ncbi:GGDEF domain-containing protein [Vibrio gangliei]|uniref:GGDEF domain-containing protein n=1 Tax=Vibrio gangliei TaxID=2077090 RepID=UPI000D01A08B|nr:sensor domain-containing diguanylate cyclase [Vibrio gangliei]